MKRFINFFGILSILLFQFTSCLDNDHNEKSVYYFYDEPVVVDQMGNHPIVRNESYSFYVSELADNTTLKAGDLLWTSFIVDLDNQESADQYTAKGFRYGIVDSAKVIIPANAEAFESYLSDDYSASIELSVLYKYVIDSLWFFGFQQQSQSNQLNYTYELILNPDIEKDSGNNPTLYIRAKQINNMETTNSGKSYSKGENIFAFDVADFANYYMETISKTSIVRFNLKYKSGVDKDGNDIYKTFMSNPISWDFSSRKPS